MIVVVPASHEKHHPTSDFDRGRLVAAVEIPARVDWVLAALRGLPHHFGVSHVLDSSVPPAVARVHAPNYLSFLKGAWEAWREAGHQGEARPLSWPRHAVGDLRVSDIEARLGMWGSDVGTPITAGTWEAAVSAAAASCQAASSLANGSAAAFAVTRPPGHHASRSRFGGYCYLNNAAIATESLLSNGAGRLAIVDIDYHHGDGTQSIFWNRRDVLVCSIHADPTFEFPYYSGAASEQGGTEAIGFNQNFPLPIGTAGAGWLTAIDAALALVRRHDPDVLVVSLGVDGHLADPHSRFRLEASDYRQAGSVLGAVGCPTLFVLEGGYNQTALGHCVGSVVDGFLVSRR